MSHFVSPSCRGERCGMCHREGRRVDATHKVGEEFLYGMSSEIDLEAEEAVDPYKTTVRHNLTQYLCCEHFAAVMGPLAEAWCKGEAG
jgi:hypothetical protein